MKFSPVFLVFSDFEGLPKFFYFYLDSDFHKLALKANGCVINNNHDEYPEEVIDFVSDLSLAAASGSTDVLRANELKKSIIEVDPKFQFTKIGVKDFNSLTIVNCGFAP